MAERKSLLQRIGDIHENQDNDEALQDQLNTGHKQNLLEMDRPSLIRQELGQIISTLEMRVRMNFFKESPAEIAEIVSKLEQVAERFNIDLDGYETVKFSDLKEELQKYIDGE